MRDKEQARKVRENSLFEIKESEPFTYTIKEKSLLLHYCCRSCTPSSRVSFCKILSNLMFLRCNECFHYLDHVLL